VPHAASFMPVLPDVPIFTGRILSFAVISILYALCPKKNDTDVTHFLKALIILLVDIKISVKI